MKKILITLGILSLFGAYIFAQEIHTPAEIIKIMEKSKIMYELAELKNEIDPPDRSSNLNSNHYFRVKEGNQIFTYSYTIDSVAKKHLLQAEEFFKKNQIPEARNMYKKVLNLDSNYYKVMTYIGQTYEITDDDKAIEWYKKAIEHNYIDYMAHWFLADALKDKGNINEAVEEITIAKILNRNNPRIQKSLEKIYKLKKMNTSDWVFNPQMKIDSIGKKEVKIAFDADWLGYAMTKAVWQYEPGYKESMGIEKESFSTLEERESLVSILVNLDKKKQKKYPEFKALKLALDNDMINEYIFYEIYLLKHPSIAYQLSEDFINNIKKYVIKIRGKKM